MYFESWAEFLEMGGHGLYVWLCYGVGLFAMLCMGIAPKLQNKRVVNELMQQQRRQHARDKQGSGIQMTGTKINEGTKS